MLVAEPRLQPAGERLVGEQCVEMHGRLGHAYTLPFGGDAGMEIGERLRVSEPARLGKEAVEKLKHAARAVDKAFE